MAVQEEKRVKLVEKKLEGEAGCIKETMKGGGGQTECGGLQMHCGVFVVQLVNCSLPPLTLLTCFFEYLAHAVIQ